MIKLKLEIKIKKEVFMEIFDGNKRSEEIKQSLKKEVLAFKRTPKLAVVSIGNDSASTIYVKNKEKFAKEVGIECVRVELDADVSKSLAFAHIRNLNLRPDIDGIILQLPVPSHLDAIELTSAISPEKDVDGFTGSNLGELILNQTSHIPCTPSGILDILSVYNYDLEGKNAVVIGRSNIIGKPLAIEMINKGATVTVCNSKTDKATLKSLCLMADVVVVATGSINTVGYDELQKAKFVIDVGVNKTVEGKLTGDVDFESLKVNNFDGVVTPVPGGVGPMTVAHLMKNTVEAYKKRGRV